MHWSKKRRNEIKQFLKKKRPIKDNRNFNLNSYWDTNKMWSPKRFWDPKTPWFFKSYKSKRLVKKQSVFFLPKGKKNDLILDTKRLFMITIKQSTPPRKVPFKIAEIPPTHTEIKEQKINRFFDSQPYLYESLSADRVFKFQTLDKLCSLYYNNLREHRCRTGLQRITKLCILLKLNWYFFTKLESECLDLLFKLLIIYELVDNFFIWEQNALPTDQVSFQNAVDSQKFINRTLEKKQYKKWLSLFRGWEYARIDKKFFYLYSPKTRYLLLRSLIEGDTIPFNRQSSTLIELKYLWRLDAIFRSFEKYLAFLMFSKFINQRTFLDHLTVLVSSDSDLSPILSLSYIFKLNHFYLCRKWDKHKKLAKFITNIDKVTEDIEEILFFVKRSSIALKYEFFTENYLKFYMMSDRITKLYLRYDRNHNYILRENRILTRRERRSYFWESFRSEPYLDKIFIKYYDVKMSKSPEKRKKVGDYVTRFFLRLFIKSIYFKNCFDSLEEMGLTNIKLNSFLRKNFFDVLVKLVDSVEFSIDNVNNSLTLFLHLLYKYQDCYKMKDDLLLFNFNKVSSWFIDTLGEFEEEFYLKNKLGKKTLIKKEALFINFNYSNKFKFIRTYMSDRINKLFCCLVYVLFLFCIFYYSNISFISLNSSFLSFPSFIKRKKKKTEKLLATLLGQHKDLASPTKSRPLFDELYGSSDNTMPEFSFIETSPLEEHIKACKKEPQNEIEKKRSPYRLRPVNVLYSSLLCDIFDMKMYQYIISTSRVKILFRKNSILFRFKSRNLKGLLVFGYKDDGSGLIEELKIFGTYELIDQSYYLHFKSIISYYFNALNLVQIPYNTYFNNLNLSRSLNKKLTLLQVYKNYNLKNYFFKFMRFNYLKNTVKNILSQLMSFLKTFLIELNILYYFINFTKDLILLFMLSQKLKIVLNDIIRQFKYLFKFYWTLSGRINKINDLVVRLAKFFNLNSIVDYSLFRNKRSLLNRIEWDIRNEKPKTELELNLFNEGLEKRSRRFFSRYYRGSSYYKRFVFLRLLNLLFYWIIYFFSSYWVYYFRIVMNLWIRMMNLIQFRVLNNYDFCHSLGYMIKSVKFYVLSSSIEVLYYLRNFYNYSIKIYNYIYLISNDAAIKDQLDSAGTYRYIYKRKQLQLKLVVKGVDFNYGLKLKNI